MQHGGGGWSANFFLPFAKSVTEKQQQQGGLCGGRRKYFASLEVRGVRIFACLWLPCGAARNILSGENLTAFCRTLFPPDFISISQIK